MQYKINSESDMDNLTGIFTVVESGEVADIADIRFGYDGQSITLESTETKNGASIRFCPLF